RARPRAVTQPARAGRVPTHARPRRRRDRVHDGPAARGCRIRCRSAADLDGARRDSRPLRSGGGHPPGPHRRRDGARRDRPRTPRSDDGWTSGMSETVVAPTPAPAPYSPPPAAKTDGWRANWRSHLFTGFVYLLAIAAALGISALIVSLTGASPHKV